MSTGASSNSHPTGKPEISLTPCEFEIMEVLWRLKSATVRQVHSVLQPTRGLAYTTVMTVMDKLYRKGALDQQRQGRAYLYSVQISQKEALNQRIERLILDYFHGSTEQFFTYLREEFGLEEVPDAPREQVAAEPVPAPDMDTTLL